MISFERDGKTIKCYVDSPVPTSEDKCGDAQYEFHVTCSTPSVAELVAKHLTERLDEAIRGVRKAEYDQGWFDRGRHKRGVKKMRTFSHRLTPCSTRRPNRNNPYAWDWR